MGAFSFAQKKGEDRVATQRLYPGGDFIAKMTIQMPDDFTEKISRLDNKTDEIMSRVLQAGARVVLSKVKSNLQAAVGKGTKHESRSTGELINSLGVSGARVDGDGNHDVKIGFAEPRGGGGSNARIAAVIEYGKSNQPAKPFLAPAKSATRKPCIEAMKTALESEVENI
jgi:hypothetical protein